jgi:hypothetical protein
LRLVYRVERRSSEEPFVLKTFQSKPANAASIARFKAEAETWVNLGKHPNIVQCHWIREFADQLLSTPLFVLATDLRRQCVEPAISVIDSKPNRH